MKFNKSQGQSSLIVKEFNKVDWSYASIVRRGYLGIYPECEGANLQTILDTTIPFSIHK